MMLAKHSAIDIRKKELTNLGDDRNWLRPRVLRLASGMHTATVSDQSWDAEVSVSALAPGAILLTASQVASQIGR